ncbi:MAG: alkaline phosphatase, partial [Bacteroidales bacterium]|nr:alkaline phosphatase [Bacteroidales bacterium]
MKNGLNYLLAISLFISFSACVSPSGNEKNSTTKNDNVVAKNIIFMIGDGMSYAQIQGTETALKKRLVMSSMPVTGNITTYSADKLITDSGAGGTALATGQKTNNGMIGMRADSTVVESLLEIFADAGKRTGLVVSCGITHATPASFVAKDISRS